MPSPFPGMDPFLESQEFFPDLHERMATYISDSLSEQLKDPYFTRLGSRVYYQSSRRYSGPDVNVLHPASGNGGSHQVSGGGAEAVAVAEATGKQPLEIKIALEEMRETFVEIYAHPGGKRLVTTIKLLSLSNKMPGKKGHRLYQRKQREMLKSKVNFVEIDLLRGGRHTTAVSLPDLQARAGFFTYHVCLRRLAQKGSYFVYSIQLAEPLPKIDVPLLPADSPVVLDLQALFERAYDAPKYGSQVNYRGPIPGPPLADKQADWVHHLLREKGLLTSSNGA